MNPLFSERQRRRRNPVLEAPETENAATEGAHAISRFFLGGPAPMQPTLTEYQQGAQFERGQTRRPSVLPFTRDAQTGELMLAMPAIADINTGNPATMASRLAPVATSGNEMILGAGRVKTAKAPPRISDKPSDGKAMFDYSRLNEVPDVPQFDLPRNNPARGVPQRIQDVTNNPDVRARMKEVIQEGLGKGGANWYNTEPLRQSFVKELGEEAGNANYRKYMELVAATSPRSDVGTNVRNASYYYSKAMKGEPPPEVGTKNPAPYGHMAQKLHQMNVNRVLGEGWDPLNNPKPASFVENLAGNQQPATIDTHAFRLPAILAQDPRFLETAYKSTKDVAPFNAQKAVESGELAMRDVNPAWWQAMPKGTEYGALEKYYQGIAKEMGLTPAQAQAAAWVGGGKITGLASDESKPFMRFFEDRVNLTAGKRGQEPEEVLRQFIRGEQPLLVQQPAGGLGGLGGIPASDPRAEWLRRQRLGV